MDEENAISIDHRATLLCGKAWTAYCGSVVLALLLCAGLLWLGLLWNAAAAAAVLLLAALALAVRVLSIRSYRLYYDDVGVWLASGILPWSKGVSGVKWRDMDEATFVAGFWSWVFKSYTIRIGHRFTKSSEITLTGMARGKDVVALLNARHQDMIRSRAID